MPLEPLIALGRAHREFSTRLESVAGSDWPRQSVCEDWSVGDLVDHVIGGNAFTIGVLGGASVEQAMDVAIEAATAGAARRKTAYLETAATMLDLVGRPGALDRTYHHTTGNLPGTELTVLRTNDIALHTWDLARSIGADETLDAQLVDAVWRDVSLRSDEMASSGLYGTGASGGLSADAPLQERLLDFTGRRPWTADTLPRRSPAAWLESSIGCPRGRPHPERPRSPR